MEPGEALLGIDVPCDHDAPATVREALGRIEGLGWMVGDAMLVASELVTNAVLHSGGRTEDLIKVRISRISHGLVISVSDPGYSGRSATVTPQDKVAIGGLGLRVVDSIAARWGAERQPGYRVWAELRVAEGDC